MHAGPTGTGAAAAQGAAHHPDPGTTRVDHMQENLGAAGVKPDAGLLRRLEALINQDTVAGDRYSEQSNREVDADVF